MAAVVAILGDIGAILDAIMGIWAAIAIVGRYRRDIGCYCGDIGHCHSDSGCYHGHIDHYHDIQPLS